MKITKKGIPTVGGFELTVVALLFSGWIGYLVWAEFGQGQEKVVPQIEFKAMPAPLMPAQVVLPELPSHRRIGEQPKPPEPPVYKKRRGPALIPSPPDPTPQPAPALPGVTTAAKV